MIASGSKDFLVALERKIYEFIYVKSKLSQISKHCYLLRYSCRRGLKLAEWIYKDSNFYLKRKFNKYQIALS